MEQPLSALPPVDPSAVAMFLDFDGVLAPIVATPDLSGLAPRTRASLAALYGRLDGALAVVSGRALDDLESRLAPLALPAAGSHGLEMRFGAGPAERPQIDDVVRAAIDEVVAFAESHALIVERKAAGASVHYRTRPEMAELCLETVDRVAAGAGLRVVHGKMIAEMSVDASDKGKAVAAFMDTAPFKGRRPLVAGDDVTDEDAFRVVVAMGGVAVKVGDGPTAANWRARDIDEFLDWLARLAGETTKGAFARG